MSRPPLRVLVAEDHNINAQFLVLLLQRIGLQADIARDGAEAVRMLQAHPYTAVLMDLYMPVMNGVEATRAIRALPAPACHTPVVLVTAEDEHDIEGLTPELQLAALAAKPLRDAELRRALATCGITLADSLGLPHGNPEAQAANDGASAADGQSATAGTDTPPLVDETQFRRAVSLMPTELRVELLNELFDAPHGAVNMLRSALVGGSPHPLRLAAHKLKGSAMMLGLPRLQQVCARIEQQARDAQPDQRVDAVLREELAHTVQDTRDMLAQLR